MIMDGSYTARIKAQCATSTHHSYTHQCTHGQPHHHCLQSWSAQQSCEKTCLNTSLEPSVNSDRVGTFHRLAGSKFQTDGATKLGFCLLSFFFFKELVKQNNSLRFDQLLICCPINADHIHNQ